MNSKRFNISGDAIRNLHILTIMRYDTEISTDLKTISNTVEKCL